MAAEIQPENFSRLQEEQKRAVEDCRSRVTQWEQFGNDYDALYRKLTDLPRKVTHNIMVPFGRFAFMPGQLYHTNEIHVLLGDNWFALRSAQQAAEIVDRRKKFVLEKLKASQEELHNLEEQAKHTEEFQLFARDRSKFVEIKEEVQGEEAMSVERKRVAHTPNWSKKTAVSERQKVETPSQEQLWARLDELEELEKERMELGTEPPLPSESENVPSERVPVENRITFQHTPSVSRGTVKKQSSGGGVIASPADLFLMFAKQDSNLVVEPKTRMEEEPQGEGKKGVKWSKDLESVQPIPNREEKRVQNLHKETKSIPVPLGEECCYDHAIHKFRDTPPSAYMAFSGVVSERTVSHSREKPSSETEQQQKSVHKVSKFKASRQKR